MHFELPEIFFLAIPLAFWFWRFEKSRGLYKAIRIFVVALILFSLASPVLEQSGDGVDLVIVCDRSKSMAEDSELLMKELVEYAEKSRTENSNYNRLAIVSFGEKAATEKSFSPDTLFDNFRQPITGEATNLKEALREALFLIPEKNSGRILLFSDGEFTEKSPFREGRIARERNIPIDFRTGGFTRPPGIDVKVRALNLPLDVHLGHKFQFNGIIESSRKTEAAYELIEVMNGQESRLISSGKTTLKPGVNSILFRDTLFSGGTHEYYFSIEPLNIVDPVKENNKVFGALYASPIPSILLVSPYAGKGKKGNLERALEKSLIQVTAVSPSDARLSPGLIDAHRGVILENVSTYDLPSGVLKFLKQYVKDLGGGLMLTGGQKSFGAGGYYKSYIDEILPVSLEQKKVVRKVSMALAVVLDRSGSMSMPVAGNLTKMDLANLGTSAVIDMMTPMDEICVIAVDTSPHMIVPMTSVHNKKKLQSKVKTIQSMGGGIYVYTGLSAAAQKLLKSPAGIRHIILFSDAQDSEEPGAYKKLLKDLTDVGVTVSVIGLGNKGDCDAAFLEDIAKRGIWTVCVHHETEGTAKTFQSGDNDSFKVQFY